MGQAYHKRPFFTPGLSESVQNITLTGVSGNSPTRINPNGATFITSTGTGAGWNVTLNPPGIYKGNEKTIWILLSGASTVPVTVRTASSSQVFFGSTRNSVTCTTAVGSTMPLVVSFVAKSSKQWAIKSITQTATTYATAFTSTGSTKG